MTATLQTVARHVVVLAVLVASAGVVACGDKNSPDSINPAAPTSDAASATATPPATSTPPVTSTPTTGSITCSAELSQPGDTCQLTMMVTLTDGSSRDVTADARWGYGGAVSGSPSGLVTARSYGIGYIFHNAYREVQPISMKIRVVPAGSFIVTGRVAEGGFKVEDARISARSTADTATTTSGFDGGYVLAPVSGNALIRVEREGYVTQERKVNVQGDDVADFNLVKSGAATGLDGVYTLAFVAAPSCTLPKELMQRTYQTRITEKAGDLLVELGGPAFPEDGWFLYGFRGKRDGSAVRFDIHATPGDPVADYDYIFSESLDGFCTFLDPCRTEHRYLSFKGAAAGSISDRGIPTVFSGTVLLYTGTRTLAQCTGDHRLEFVK